MTLQAGLGTFPVFPITPLLTLPTPLKSCQSGLTVWGQVCLPHWTGSPMRAGRSHLDPYRFPALPSVGEGVWDEFIYRVGQK